VENGGALLVATDGQTPALLERHFGTGVSGTFLTLPTGGENAYRRMPECPYIDPVKGARPPLFEPGLPALRGAPPKRIASNKPSHLNVARWRFLPVLATLPAQCTDGRGNFHVWDFAVGGDLGNGRVLVMADHSVFINEMMLQNDNGNIDFAYRCADWLRGDPARPRDRVLYYEDGVVQTQFDIPLKDLPPPPLPPPDTWVGMADEFLRGMEDEGTFRQMEEEGFFDGVVADLMGWLPFWAWATPEVKLWTLVVLVVSVALGLYAFVRLGAFRHRPDATVPALAALLEKQAPAGAVIEQRQQALLSDGNLWEAARELARHLFASAGISPDAGPAPPVIEARGGWWRRWRARRQWRHLWRLARSAQPVRVSPHDFARLASQVKELQAALAAGTVRIIRE
jgi:hypothetical protein